MTDNQCSCMRISQRYNVKKLRLFFNMKSQQLFRLTVKPIKNDKDEPIEEGKDLALKGPESPLYNAVLPMIYAVRFFGFAPYEFDKDDLVPSIKNTTFTVIAASFYSYVFVNFSRRLTYTSFVHAEDTVLVTTERGKVFYKLNFLHKIAS